MKKTFLCLITFLTVVMMSSPVMADTVYFTDIKAVITSATHKYIDKAMHTAQENNAAAIVFKLDTPGGTLDSTREIVQSIMASPIPVAIYVSPSGARAGSAGTFITLAANYAVMADGTNIGAAHPVGAAGEDIQGDMRDKTLNDTVSFMRSIAEKRGRNISEAILTVTESKSFTASEALRAGLIDAVVHDDEALILMLEEDLGVTLNRVDIVPTLTENVSFFLSDPNILMLLMMLGMLMIFLEFKMPGTFIFAGTGIVAIILFLVGSNLIPINFLALLMVIGGMGLIVAEIFVSSFGLLALAGVVTMIGGIRLLFDTEGVQGVAVSISLMVFMALFVAGVVLFIGRLIIKDMRRKPVVGMNSLTGKTASVMEWKGHEGKVYVHGEIWSASSDEVLRKGDSVIIDNADSFILKVSKEESPD